MALLNSQLCSTHSLTDNQLNLFWEAVIMYSIIYVKHAAKWMRTIGCYILEIINHYLKVVSNHRNGRAIADNRNILEYGLSEKKDGMQH